jgi:protein SCO1/2
MRKVFTVLALSAWTAASAVAQVNTQDPKAQPYLDVGITQKLNAQVPMDAELYNEQYEKVTLKELIGGKPTVLSLVYYECPMLCNMVLNGLLESMQANEKFSCGEDYNVITISFDPEETHVLAAEKKQNYVEEYGRKSAEKGWSFLVGAKDVTEAIAQTVGFGYKFVPETGEYSHGSGLILLTPEGRVARYLPGTTYPAREFHLSLVEASEGKIGSLSDKIFLRCFQYDPETRKYSALITSTIRTACLATVGIFGSFIFVMFKRDLKTQKKLTEQDTDTAGGS